MMSSGDLRRAGLAALAALAGACLLAAGSAAAKTVTPYEYSGVSFDGSGSTAGAFADVGGVAIDQQTGDVFVIDRSKRRLSRFDAQGNAVPFANPPLPGSSLEIPLTGRNYVAIDNSGGPHQGRIYVADRSPGSPIDPRVFAFEPDGQPVGGSWPLCGARCGKPGEFVAEPEGVAVDEDGTVWVTTTPSGFLTPNPAEIVPFTPDGERIAGRAMKVRGAPRSLDLDSEGSIYARNSVLQDDLIRKYVPQEGHPIGADFPDGVFSRPTAPSPNSSSDSALAVDRAAGLVFANQADRVEVYDPAGRQLDSFGQPDPGTYGGLIAQSRGIAVNESTKDVYVGNSQAGTVDVFERGAPVVVPDVTTGEPTGVDGTGAVLHGTVDPDGGGDTTVCRFEWGLSARLENSAPCAEGQVHPSEGGPVQVSAQITGLLKGRQYHYRLVAGNANGPLQSGRDRSLWAADPPTVEGVDLVSVDTDTADVEVRINPQGGGEATYRVEVGESPSYGLDFPPPPQNVFAECYFPWLSPKEPPCPGRLLWTNDGGTARSSAETATVHISGLEPDTTYHYRVVAENNAGATAGSDRTFHTFAHTPVIEDSCPNKLARQQTGAAQLLDCRAYELVSAADAGGYDVRSDLAPGETPLPGFPEARDRALYSVLDGGIPGTGNSPNRGPDPYVATRNAAAERWDTRYVGIPADAPSTAPFSSTLADADASLSTFVFGGPELCSPCFADGSTNVPIRMPDGSLERGMRGSLDPGVADPAGEVRKPISADGSHLVFATTARFEQAGNDNGTDVTIYDRDLESGTTQVVSTLPSGDTMAVGDEIAQLDISRDGSRIVVAERLGTDAEGNDLWHPYMHVGSSPNSIDLAPGASTGVRYAGMTADGRTVFLATRDRLTADDTDDSIDVFRVDVNGSAAVARVSTGIGGAGDGDGCEPEPNSVDPHWNGSGGSGDCSALPLAGGAGVAPASGVVYFLSPEKLDGNGSEGEPNLFRAAPGEAPELVATLESRATGPQPLSTSHPFAFSFGSLANPQSVAIHQSTGDVFVLDVNAGAVRKFDSEGNPSDFSSTPGSNSLTGLTLADGFSQVAVDSSGGPTDGNIYVTSSLSGTVRIFDSTGAPVGTLSGSTTPFGSFLITTGVAVDPSGNVYVGAFTGGVFRYAPSGPVPTDADYDAVLNAGELFAVAPIALAADAEGAVYVHKTGSTGMTRYRADQFGLPTPSGSAFDPASKAVAIDPADGHVYASRGDEVVEYLPSGVEHGRFGSGDLTNSLGLAVHGGTSRIYAADVDGGTVDVFGTELGADRRIDSPIVVHAANSPEGRHAADFQTTPTGDVAAFTSTVPYTGYENRGTAQVFRYEAGAPAMACVSCAPTGRPSSADASLAANGLSVTDDGRVFFNSRDRLVLRDGNNRQDVYEWSREVGSEGGVELVSTGVSEADSSLLSVSSDGTDALFFTRQKLVPQDLNGPTVKLYSARAGGGFFTLPETQPCKASDECRGAGSVPAPPAAIRSVTGREGQVGAPAARTCDPRRHARRARRMSRRARALRRAGRAGSGKAAARRLRRARRAARAARRERDAARECRRAQSRSAKRSGR